MVAGDPLRQVGEDGKGCDRHRLVLGQRRPDQSMQSAQDRAPTRTHSSLRFS